MTLDVDYAYGDIKVVASNPIPMIVKAEMMRGDIVLVDGNRTMSNIIKLGTWSQFSHAAIYDGYGKIYQAVTDGVEGADLNVDIKSLPLIAVLRPINYNPAAADNAVNYARRNAGELGGVKKKYDIPGAISSGISWKMAIIITPLLPFKVSEATKNAFIGNDDTFFCSEMVTQSYKQAGMPLLPIQPQDAVPGAIYYSTNLVRVGYLKYMI